MVQSLKKKRKVGDGPTAEGIDDIFTPLVIEPQLAALDDNYEDLGWAFKESIDLYVGRKCGKVIPLLVASAKFMHEKGFTSKAKRMEGGGADHYYWVESFNGNGYISMRWDTQSRSYYIMLDRDTGLEKWRLKVAEYKLGERRKEAKDRWEKEPGYVLEYESQEMRFAKDPEFKLDEQKCENAWLRLAEIGRWMSLINTVCCMTQVSLYSGQFNPDKAAGRAYDERKAKNAKK